MAGEDKKIEVLVADTTAFIKNAQLQDLAIKVVTVPEVVNEIKCKRQLSRLVVLPYELEVKDVFPESLKAVRDFSIKTGDYKSLSPADLKVLALTYQLEKEKVGTDHIRLEPVQQLPTVVTKKLQQFDHLPGFYVPHSNVKKRNGVNHTEVCEEEREEICDMVEAEEEKKDTVDEGDSDKDVDEGENEKEESDDNEWTTVRRSERKMKSRMAEPVPQLPTIEASHELPSEDSERFEGEDQEEEEEEEEEENGDEEDEDDSDGGEWITPETELKFNGQTGGNSSELEDKPVKVACMTTDYAMQNVLKQMNLNLAALDGRVIKHLRIFVFRCYACFKITRNMTLRFCPKCGNETLKKVATSLGEDGKLIVHLNPRKRMSAKRRRTLGSMPRFKGGKHPNNPVIVADQPMPDNKPSRIARTKTDVLAENYIGLVEGFSPFAARDTASKSAMIKFRGEKGATRRNYK